MAGAIACLWISSLYSYLLFHTLTEVFTVAVAWSVFFLAWNARTYLDRHYLLLVGASALFVGFIVLLHTVSYKGMGVFPPGANMATQLWIGGRMLEAVSLVAAPMFLKRRLNLKLGFAVLAVVTAALTASIVRGGIFPDCYLEGVGLTPFKVASEYAITALLGVATLLLFLNRAEFERGVFRLLAASLLLNMSAELAFTLYVDVYGTLNLVGHLFRFAAFYLVYRALLVTGVERPHALLYRSLAEREEALRQTNQKLEAAVEEQRRLATERQQLIDDLQQALAHVKQLKGLLPICAQCKKIRDDEGYWKRVETYITERTEVSFTHSLCPECARVVYRELAESAAAGQD